MRFCTFQIRTTQLYELTTFEIPDVSNAYDDIVGADIIRFGMLHIRTKEMLEIEIEILIQFNFVQHNCRS